MGGWTGGIPENPESVSALCRLTGTGLDLNLIINPGYRVHACHVDDSVDSGSADPAPAGDGQEQPDGVNEPRSRERECRRERSLP